MRINCNDKYLNSCFGHFKVTVSCRNRKRTHAPRSLFNSCSFIFPPSFSLAHTDTPGYWLSHRRSLWPRYRHGVQWSATEFHAQLTRKSSLGVGLWLWWFCPIFFFKLKPQHASGSKIHLQLCGAVSVHVLSSAANVGFYAAFSIFFTCIVLPICSTSLHCSLLPFYLLLTVPTHWWQCLPNIWNMDPGCNLGHKPPFSGPLWGILNV